MQRRPGVESVDIDQAKERLAELIDEILGGNEIIITRERKPVAKLVSVSRSRAQRRFGSAKGLIEISPDFDEPLVELAEYK